MIPTTAAAVVGFLLFIAPGLVWELLRERDRPALTGSTFREASRVALVSVVCTGGAVLVVAVVRGLWAGAMPDPRLWIHEGSRYFEHHYRLIGRTLFVELGVACLLAWAPHRWDEQFRKITRWFLPATSKPRMSQDPVLYGVTRGELRPGDGELGIVARLQDGTIYSGMFGGLDFGYDRDASFLALQGEIARSLQGQKGPVPMKPGRHGRLVISLAEIRELWVLEPPL
jgi:Family of unknown function (DUF6338)